ncbi:MAG: hypothetical protein V1676_02095 [Candidatus Diapherotrites archaeon]
MDKKTKELFTALYKDYPDGRLPEERVHNIIVTEEDRNLLVKNGFLLMEDSFVRGKNKKYYNLGPNGLTLISSWEMERLTKWIIILTFVIIFLTAYGVIATINDLAVKVLLAIVAFLIVVIVSRVIG